MNTTAMRIGEVAERVGVTTRTLRYYEEVGLVTPSSHSSGGSRRYSEVDYARVLRIRELQAVMGFNLDEIRELLDAGDRIDKLRAEYRAGASPKRTAEIVREASRLNARTQAQVVSKIGVLQLYLDELHADAVKYKTFARQNDIALDLDNEAEV
ncbi:MAG: MerR family transcriptional regulator [Ilumatobacteraceae bacterium]